MYCTDPQAFRSAQIELDQYKGVTDKKTYDIDLQTHLRYCHRLPKIRRSRRTCLTIFTMTDKELLLRQT